MEQEEKDIRYYKTEQAIIKSLISLMKQYDFEQISVKMICERAAVSRSGFYSHYFDKYEIIEHYQENLVKRINQTITFVSAGEDSYEIFQNNIIYLQENFPLLLLLISQKDSYVLHQQFLQRLQRNLRETVLPQLQLTFKNEREKTYFIGAFSSLLFSVLQTWIQSGQQESPAELKEMIHSIFRTFHFLPFRGS